MVGDFNGQFGTHQMEVISLLDLLSTYGLKQRVFDNTRGNSCLDNIFISSDDTTMTELVHFIISAHLGHSITLNIGTNKKKRLNIFFIPITVQGMHTS